MVIAYKNDVRRVEKKVRHPLTAPKKCFAPPPHSLPYGKEVGKLALPDGSTKVPPGLLKKAHRCILWLNGSIQRLPK